MKLTVIGMDIAKHVFQLHAVNPYTGEIECAAPLARTTDEVPHHADQRPAWFAP